MDEHYVSVALVIYWHTSLDAAVTYPLARLLLTPGLPERYGRAFLLAALSRFGGEEPPAAVFANICELNPLR